MNPDELRSRLEALLGPVHLADRAAEALGCDRRSVNRWMQGHQKVPLRVIQHVEDIEFFAVGLAEMYDDISPFMPPRWRKSPPP